MDVQTLDLPRFTREWVARQGIAGRAEDIAMMKSVRDRANAIERELSRAYEAGIMAVLWGQVPTPTQLVLPGSEDWPRPPTKP